MRKLTSIGPLLALRIGQSQAPRMETLREAQELILLLFQFLDIINHRPAPWSPQVTDLLLIQLNTTTGLLGVMLTLIQASK
jgi:hypothetical protein